MYYLILGQNPALSIAEILSILPHNKVASFSREVLLLDIEEQVDARGLMSKLGGCVKIGKVELKWPEMNIGKGAAQIIDNFFDLEGGKKIFFGISTYFVGGPSAPPRLAHFTRSLGVRSGSARAKILAREIKNILKQRGISARWVVSREKNLSSVVVAKNKLLTQGAEICLLADGEKIYVGRTLAVQEFEKYSQRDYGREHRDARSGMIPPKLAKIMINLASVKPGGTILDPFCGSGTIVQESVLTGYRMVGSDVSEKAVADSKENLRWIIGKHVETQNFAFIRTDKNTKTQKNITNYNLFQCDARNISVKIPPQSIDAIVTEPYLGPPLRGDINEQGVKKIISELSELYLASLREFKKVLREGGAVVMAWPVFVETQNFASKQDPQNFTPVHHPPACRPGRQNFASRKRLHFLPIIEDVESMGYQIKNPLPANMDKGMFYEMTERGTIVYARADQRVGREIVTLQILDF